MLDLVCCLVKALWEYCFSCTASACPLEESTGKIYFFIFIFWIFELEPTQAARGMSSVRNLARQD